MDIIKEKTCAVTGHRVLSGDFNEIKLEKIFRSLIEGGIETFLIGMAIGFDSACFCILENLRDKKKEKIKIIACIPCRTQSLKFSARQKEEYERMLEAADEKIYLSEEYDSRCMFKRNKFMVDNASVLVAYLRKNVSSGGSFNTVTYALKKGIPVVNLAAL